MSDIESTETADVEVVDPDAAGDDSGVNVPLTDDDQVAEDGTVSLSGNFADCVDAAGRAFSVRLTNAERVAWERASRKHHWGAAGDSPHEALTFMAWTAARRAGDPAGALTYDQFIDQVPDVEGRVAPRVRPTR